MNYLQRRMSLTSDFSDVARELKVTGIISIGIKGIQPKNPILSHDVIHSTESKKHIFSYTRIQRIYITHVLDKGLYPKSKYIRLRRMNN